MLKKSYYLLFLWGEVCRSLTKKNPKIFFTKKKHIFNIILRNKNHLENIFMQTQEPLNTTVSGCCKIIRSFLTNIYSLINSFITNIHSFKNLVLSSSLHLNRRRIQDLACSNIRWLGRFSNELSRLILNKLHQKLQEYLLVTYV